MADVDTQLVTALRQCTSTRMYFAFIPVGTSGKLLVSKKKPSTKEIADAKKASGGKTAFEGRCINEGGTLFCELAKEAPDTLAKQIKAAIQQYAGMRLPVETRVAGNVEGDEAPQAQVPGATTSPPTPTPQAEVPGTTTPTPTPQSPAATPTNVRPGAVNYAQVRLAWIATRQKVAADLQKLEKSILEYYRGDPMFAEAKRCVRKLDTILENLDEELADKLDEALNAADEARRAQLNQEAAAVIARYTSFLKSNQLVAGVDSNPFVPVNVKSLLTKSLATLAAEVS